MLASFLDIVIVMSYSSVEPQKDCRRMLRTRDLSSCIFAHDVTWEDYRLRCIIHAVDEHIGTSLVQLRLASQICSAASTLYYQFLSSYFTCGL